MDANHFDALVRRLSPLDGWYTRRTALVALLASGLGVLAIGDLAMPEGSSAKQNKKNTTRRQGRRRGRDVSAEGPCGDGEGKANRCQRDGQCCTGYCHKKRCRCQKEGGACVEDRNCCPARNGLTCQSGVCQPASSDNCPGCTGCCADGTCQPGTENDACGAIGAPCQACPASSPICGISDPGVCGACVKRNCTQAGANCGPVSDGCGGTIDCGTCTGMLTCGGGGVPSVCGPGSACTPRTCAQQDVHCGPTADGCGGLIACGGCSGAEICVAGTCR